MASPLRSTAPPTDTDHGFDRLARRLAQPIGRRQAVGVFGGTVAALLLPPLRGGRAMVAWGVEGTTVCQAESANCREVICYGDTKCCCSPPGENSGCSSCNCCDPCDPDRSTCDGNGRCGPGPIDNELCCRRINGVPCGSGGCCPKPSKGRVVCGKRKALCCEDIPPPVFFSSGAGTKARAAAAGRLNPTRYYCATFEPACAKASAADYHRDMGACVRKMRADPKAPPRQSNAFYFYPCFIAARHANTERLIRCDKLPEHGACSGGECITDNFSCCSYTGIPPATQRSVPAEAPVRDRPEEDGESVATAAARVSRAELRRRVRRAEPRLQRTGARLLEAQELALVDADERDVVVAACDAHRKEVLRLRRNVAAGRGGRPQRLLLRSYDATAVSLLTYRNALAISNRPESLPLLEEAREQGLRADRLAARALRALN